MEFSILCCFNSVWMSKRWRTNDWWAWQGDRSKWRNVLVIINIRLEEDILSIKTSSLIPKCSPFDYINGSPSILHCCEFRVLAWSWPWDSQPVSIRHLVCFRHLHLLPKDHPPILRQKILRDIHKKLLFFLLKSFDKAIQTGWNSINARQIPPISLRFQKIGLPQFIFLKAR